MPISKIEAAATQFLKSLGDRVTCLQEAGHANVRVDQIYSTANQLDNETTLSLTIKIASDGIPYSNQIGFAPRKDNTNEDTANLADSSSQPPILPNVSDPPTNLHVSNLQQMYPPITL